RVNSTNVASRKKITSMRGIISMRAFFLPSSRWEAAPAILGEELKEEGDRHGLGAGTRSNLGFDQYVFEALLAHFVENVDRLTEFRVFIPIDQNPGGGVTEVERFQTG